MDSNEASKFSVINRMYQNIRTAVVSANDVLDQASRDKISQGLERGDEYIGKLESAAGIGGNIVIDEESIGYLTNLYAVIQGLTIIIEHARDRHTRESYKTHVSNVYRRSRGD